MLTLSGLWALWQQFYPPAPTFTEKDVGPGSQVGRVFIITGANSGTVPNQLRIGFALVKLLYPTGATIYLAGRSPAKIQAAIAEVSSVLPPPTTPSNLKPLLLDLSDLKTVKPAAELFAAQETRLDILWNNAGNGCPPGSVTKQGLEAHIGANCVAPLLFTQELLPMLRAAAQTATPSSVRIVWSGSIQIDMSAPQNGVDFTRIEKPTTVTYEDYGASKAGNWFFAVEGARRWGRYGIVSVCQNPGNLYTGIYANENRLFVAFLKRFVLYEAKYGAYTMLYSGLSPEVSQDTNGAYIWPWGRIQPIARPDVLNAASEGKAAELWEWCETQWKQHV
ncbi:NAD(P)-binding protein [Daldinia vernicosa]|uniref:NAD(P)-binding protein n=1 Tax=Daldinia vernicosa TaxID=114800 RepID=UPI00200798AC|nr:NAD(P)-binding protein [Daldinia vernicosa]KAI0853138.1 NAD(P)-binding protein [Daldinia vernicosa]